MVTAKKLAEFLESVERQEDLLQERLAEQDTTRIALAAEDRNPNLVQLPNPTSAAAAELEDDTSLIVYEEM